MLVVGSESQLDQCCHIRYLFFFSSRRRHTRLQGDWSSDVCSSDLTSPSTWSAGRRTSSRKICDDLLPRMPSFSSGGPQRTPLVFIGRMNAVMPRWPAALSFIVNNTQTSATGPLVIQFLVPLITQLSPSRTAVVFCAAASLPASGSLSAKQPSSLPEASGTSHCSFCASVA